jgi:tRNA G46 methylase TrmB
MGIAYVHRYDGKEIIRLKDQANTLVELLHSDPFYPAGCRVLEAGCGVGAQTVTLAAKNPDTVFKSIEVSAILFSKPSP